MRPNIYATKWKIDVENKIKWSINKHHKDLKRIHAKISKYEIKNKEIFVKNKPDNTKKMKMQCKDEKILHNMNISKNIETNQQQNIDVVEINDMMIDDCDLEQIHFRVSSGECY